jgi:hypothetical protein
MNNVEPSSIINYLIVGSGQSEIAVANYLVVNGIRILKKYTKSAIWTRCTWRSLRCALIRSSSLSVAIQATEFS